MEPNCDENDEVVEERHEMDGFLGGIETESLPQRGVGNRTGGDGAKRHQFTKFPPASLHRRRRHL